MQPEHVRELGSGDQIIMDGQAGKFTVLKPIRLPGGRSAGVYLLDGDLKKYELRLARTDETFLDFRAADDAAPVRIEGECTKVYAFERTGSDERVIRDYMEKLQS